MSILRDYSNQQKCHIFEIMDRPQEHHLKVEFLLLVRIVRFNSYPQLFQLFNQQFKDHI
jgi:hypothetical protein